MKKAIAALILLTMVFGLWGGLGVASATATPVAVGQSASDFTATLLNGIPFQLSSYLGKVVIVNVWASWCGPCISEIPDLQKLSEAYPETLVVLGLNNQETWDTVSQFVADNNLTYPQATDESGTLINSVFPTQYIPYTVVIDPNGVVTQAEAGTVAKRLTGGVAKRRPLVGDARRVQRFLHGLYRVKGILQYSIQTANDCHGQDYVAIFAAHIYVTQTIVRDTPNKVCDCILHLAIDWP